MEPLCSILLSTDRPDPPIPEDPGTVIAIMQVPMLEGTMSAGGAGSV
jgi:hypothetical protein